jgi:hypothetical protein
VYYGWRKGKKIKDEGLRGKGKAKKQVSGLRLQE